MTFGSCQPFKHALQYALSISTPHPSSHPHSQLASQPTIQPGSQSIGHLITTHKVTMCRVIKSHKKSFSPCELSTQSSTSFYHLKMPSTHWLPHDTDDNMKQVGHLNAIHPYQSSADTIKTSRKVSKYSSRGPCQKLDGVFYLWNVFLSAVFRRFKSPILLHPYQRYRTTGIHILFSPTMSTLASYIHKPSRTTEWKRNKKTLLCAGIGEISKKEEGFLIMCGDNFVFWSLTRVLDLYCAFRSTTNDDWKKTSDLRVNAQLIDKT